MELFGKSDGFLRAAHIRLGDNFNQRCTRTIQINAGHTMGQVALMGRFPCIFFKMSMMNANRFL